MIIALKESAADALIFWQGHLHGEDKSGATVLTLRLDVNLPSAVFNDALADHETDSNAFSVKIAGPISLAKHFEELIFFFLIDAHSCVNYMHYELFLAFIVRGTYLDFATNCEL